MLWWCWCWLILLSVMSLKRKYGKKFKALWIPYYVTLLWSDLSSKLITAVVQRSKARKWWKPFWKTKALRKQPDVDSPLWPERFFLKQIAAHLQVSASAQTKCCYERCCRCVPNWATLVKTCFGLLKFEYTIIRVGEQMIMLLRAEYFLSKQI